MQFLKARGFLTIRFPSNVLYIANIFKVSWNWNGSHPSGIVGDVKAGEVSVTSQRGNEIKKTGEENNPAVRIERSGNDVVKTADELTVEKKGEGPDGNVNGNSSEPKSSEESKKAGKEPGKEPGNIDAGRNEYDVKHVGEHEQTQAATETGEVQSGSKRKVDSTDAGTKKKDDNNGKSEAKRPKMDSTAPPHVEKKKAGRPKGSGNGDRSTSKKEKKAVAIGQAARKTRSQGKAE
jgi:hypothetical protein